MRSNAIHTLTAALGSSLLSLASVGVLVSLGPLSLAAAAEPPLESGVQAAANRLRAAWSSEPASRDLPFPSVRLLAPTAAPATLCPWKSSIAVYCQPLQTIQLNREDLSQAESYGDVQWLSGYWISLALVQVLAPANRISLPASSPAANLQANCLAGVLVAGSQLQAPATLPALLSPPLYAYGLAQTAQRGTAAQRAYAFLSGFGATDSLCDPEAMNALAEDRVPDPDRLEQIALLTRRGSSSLLAVLSSRCRPRPGATCPRRLSADRPTMPR